jgi:hypothetical protein
VWNSEKNPYRGNEEGKGVLAWILRPSIRWFWGARVIYSLVWTSAARDTLLSEFTASTMMSSTQT